MRIHTCLRGGMVTLGEKLKLSRKDGKGGRERSKERSRRKERGAERESRSEIEKEWRMKNKE